MMHPQKNSEQPVLENRANDTPVDHARQILRESPYPAIRQIECSYEGGVLTITGNVPSFYVKQLAQTAILDLRGVDRVSNRLNVAP